MQRFNPKQIYTKSNKVLHFILVALLLIGVRIWYLTVIQQEELVDEAKRPMHKVVYESANRGTIRDRFNLPLAINQINYQAAIVWSDISQLPQFTWKKDPSGNKIKIPYRRQYIEKLSSLLGKVLSMSEEKVEDLIWSTASFYGQAPFVIKEGISELEYYYLLNLSRIWPGISPQIEGIRTYPNEKLGCHVLGYMGAIDQNLYSKILKDIASFQQIIEHYYQGETVDFPEGHNSIEEVKKSLSTLQEKAYTTHDFVGKTGVEKKFENKLRGYRGKKEYESDARGNFLRELP
ncbi:hypothetical protein N9Y92_04480, partial [Chlamydiales bacterium]|nr:hypothetical protein [Chlamydiales bacterium]